jgi:hypothetical protein
MEYIKTRNTFCEINKVYEKKLIISQEQNFNLSKKSAVRF